MRGRGKYRIWPAYFNIRYSRSEGRRVPKQKAVRDPSAQEIEKAAAELGLRPLLEPGAAYPKRPWVKTGVILVDKRESKEEIIDKISEELRKNR